MIMINNDNKELIKCSLRRLFVRCLWYVVPLVFGSQTRFFDL